MTERMSARCLRRREPGAQSLRFLQLDGSAVGATCRSARIEIVARGTATRKKKQQHRSSSSCPRALPVRVLEAQSLTSHAIGSLLPLRRAVRHGHFSMTDAGAKCFIIQEGATLRDWCILPTTDDATVGCNDAPRYNHQSPCALAGTTTAKQTK